MGALERMSLVTTWMLALAACIVIASCSDWSSQGSADTMAAETDALDAPDLPEDHDIMTDDILETPDANEAEAQDGSDSFASDVDLELDLSDTTVDDGSVADEGGGTEVGPECDGGPKEGCPCNEATDEPCCLGQSVGLGCEILGKPPAYYWTKFHDCGCDPGPWCEDYTLLPLCK